MQDNGAKDAGSRWLFPAGEVEHTWTLFSAGMPSNAVIKVGDTEYRGVNAQGDTHFRAAYVDASEVSVTCGGGYVYTLVVDNANHQINVDFVQLFNPTASPTAEEKYHYLLKMPAAYVGANGGNLFGVTKKSAADRFLLIEDTARLGQYYIYDQTSATWISYSSATIGSTAKQQSESKVTVETSKASAKTWQLRLRRDGASVSILPGEISDPSGASAAPKMLFSICGVLTMATVLGSSKILRSVRWLVPQRCSLNLAKNLCTRLCPTKEKRWWASTLVA